MSDPVIEKEQDGKALPASDYRPSPKPEHREFIDDDPEKLTSSVISVPNEEKVGQPNDISVSNEGEPAHSYEISPPNADEVDQSNYNHFPEDNVLTGHAQQKQLQNQLDEKDAVKQAYNTINFVPGVGEVTPQTNTRPRRFRFLSRIPLFRNATKSKEPEVAPLTVRQIFRYADKFDILLMFVGAIAAIAAGAFFPVLLYYYRRVTNSLADLGKEQANITPANVTTSNFGECFVLLNNSAGTESPNDAIQGIIKYFILFGFLSIFAYWLAWSTWMLAAERQVRRIRYALFRNILRQEIGWFDTHNAGELNNRLIEDLDKVKDGINDKVPDSIALASRALGAMIYALIAGWKLALVFFSVSPAIIILFNITVRVIMKYTAKESQAFASASAVAQEALRNIRTVTAFHGQAKEEQRFASSLIPAKQIGVKKGLYIGICQGLTQLFAYLAFAVTFWYGLQLARTECAHYTAGTVIVIFTACLITTYSVAQFIPNLQNFAEALGSGSYVFNIIDRKTKIDASSDEGDKPQTVVGDIEFNDITFAYPARPETPVFNKLSFKIPSGKTVALVGPSGCGKSTLIQLIQRFYDPDQGQVLLDGKDIKSLNVAWLRSQIGVVSQEPLLFPGSIEENIRLGKADATNEEVQNAAKMANVHDFIMQLPGGYQTSSADKLSVDQRQRVAIARALISNPRILLLDEATSALDNASELVVQDALNKAKEGRTTIVIAQRLSTIQNADVIITLDKGQLVEYGPHNNLMERRGLYYGLVLAQAPKENEHDGDRENDDDEVEKEFVRQKLIHRTSSKQSSIASINLDDDDDDEDDDEETALTNPTKKKTTEIYVPTVLRILRLNTPEWLWILLGTANSVVYGAVSPLFALFFAEIYGLFAEPNLDEQKRLVRFYVVIVALVGLASGLSQFLISVAFTQSGLGLTMRMRKLTFSAMLQQEMSYFDYQAHSVGALVTRLSSDVAALKGLSGIRIGMNLQSLSGFVVALVISFLASWKLTFIMFCFVPVIVFAEIFQDKKNGLVELIIGKEVYTEQGGQHAAQAIGNIRTIAALRQENYFINLYKKAFNKEFWSQMFQLQLVAIGTGVAMSMTYFLIAAIFAYGSRLVERGEIRFDRVLRVFLVITFVMMPVGRTVAMIPDYSKAKRAALKILRLNKRQSRINPHDESGIILNEVIGNIEFQDIRFRYPTRPTLRILKDFSLKCASATTTALVGPSRSGKSTVIALLQRFYDPIKGRVLLDGHDIKVLNVRWLRSLMGLVQQEPVLFNLSIRENIAYGENSREVGDEEVEKAARMANIHDLIVSLPQGYETFCGDQGNQLSNGQKQQIALARALIRSPKILLLDEVTSTVDNESENIVQAALDDARSSRTCLASAHRLSTIQNSEKIVVIDHGKLKEEGTHDELLRYNGIYPALALAQQRATM